MSTKLGWRIISTYFLLLLIGLFLIYNILYSSLLDRELLAVQTPIIERSQQLAKDMEALESLEAKEEAWKKVIKEFVADRETIRYLVLDSDDTLILDSYNFKKAGDQLPLEITEELRINKNYQTRIYQSSRGEELLYTAYPIFSEKSDKVASLVAITSIQGVRSEVNGLLGKLIQYGLVFIFLSLLVYYWVLKDIFAPLDKLDEGVVAMTRGNYSYHIDEEASEFSTMVRSLNTLGSRLADIEEQQKDFVFTLSHELKTPIASMKIITDSLIMAKDTVSEEVLYDFLEDINSESDRLKDIIDDLLFMASLERQDISLNLDVRPITKALEESIRIMEPLAEQKSITINKDFQGKYFAEFDYNKMKQVFINIIGNAVKYSDEGGEIFIKVSADKDTIYFEISDQGMGIAPQDLPYIFDRLYRVDRARSRERGGSGLGLHIVQQIVHLHNGQVSMDSELEKGSTVHISIPRVYEV
ncbi:MAG: HAMP domain-containing histidine kinase [Tissierellia bacterium]|nr:HAMP domain-containing histidine kinase [Tissierellia bacterium]